jgi:hypothetical protein
MPDIKLWYCTAFSPIKIPHTSRTISVGEGWEELKARTVTVRKDIAGPGPESEVDTGYQKWRLDGKCGTVHEQKQHHLFLL